MDGRFLIFAIMDERTNKVAEGSRSRTYQGAIDAPYRV